MAILAIFIAGNLGVMIIPSVTSIF